MLLKVIYTVDRRYIYKHKLKRSKYIHYAMLYEESQRVNTSYAFIWVANNSLLYNGPPAQSPNNIRYDLTDWHVKTSAQD